MTNQYHVGDKPRHILIQMKQNDVNLTIAELLTQYEVTEENVRLSLEMKSPSDTQVLPWADNVTPDTELSVLRFNSQNSLFNNPTTWRYSVIMTYNGAVKTIGIGSITVFKRGA